MKALLLPIILFAVGSAGGIGAGVFLSPPNEEEKSAEETCLPSDPMATEEQVHPATDLGPPSDLRDREYARLNNQFVVPVVEDGRVSSLVVLSLSVEVVAGQQELIFSHEPRLRDEFLQVMFDHANMGGFQGAFTTSSNMRLLRDALRSAAVESVGDIALDVLIVDIVRQDVAG